METVIFSLSRRAEQTFTRIRLLDQLPGVDLLPCSSLPCEMSDHHVPHLMGPWSLYPILTLAQHVLFYCLLWAMDNLKQPQSPGRFTSGGSKAGGMLLIVSFSFYVYLINFTFFSNVHFINRWIVSTSTWTIVKNWDGVRRNQELFHGDEPFCHVEQAELFTVDRNDASTFRKTTATSDFE